MDIRTTLTAALLTTAAWASWPQEEQQLFSGPLEGEPIVPFEVVAATGPERDTVVDYVTRWEGAPTVYCFVHTVSRASSRAIRALDIAAQARRDDGLQMLFVMLGSDQDAIERYGLRFPQILDLDSTVGISVDGVEGPGAWGLDREMVLSVTVAKDDLTVASFPLLSPNETDVPRIMEVVDGMLVGLETFDELRDEVLSLRRDVRGLQDQMAVLASAAGVELPGADAPRVAPMRGEMRDSMGGPAEGRGASTANVLRVEDLVRSLLEPDLSDDEVRTRADDLRAALENKRNRQRAFLNLLRGMDPNGPGTPLARRQLELIAVEYGATPPADDGETMDEGGQEQ